MCAQIVHKLSSLATVSLLCLPIGAQAQSTAQSSTVDSGTSYSEQALMDHPSKSLRETQGFVSVFKNIRERAILQAAESFGSQAGYCAGVAQWNVWAHQHATVLNPAYDFTSLLVDGGRVLPPVILEDADSYRQQGRSMAVTAQTTWHILRYGKIVSVAPTWRITCCKVVPRH